MKANYPDPKTRYAQAVEFNKQYRRMISTRMFLAVAFSELLSSVVIGGHDTVQLREDV